MLVSLLFSFPLNLQLCLFLVFFVAGGSSTEQTERNSTHSSHIIFAFGFGAEMQRDFFLLSIFLLDCDLFSIINDITRVIYLIDPDKEKP